MPKQLTLEQLLRNSPQVNLHKRLLHPRRTAIKQISNHILTRTILTQDKDIGIGLFQLLNSFQQFLHHLALTHNNGQAAIALQGSHLLLQTLHLSPTLAQLHRRRNGSQQFLLLPRLRNKVNRPRLDSTHRLLRIGISGNKNHHRLRILFQYPVQPEITLVATVHIPIEIHVQQYHIGTEIIHKVLNHIGISRHFNLLHMLLQQQVERKQNVLVIIYNQYLTFSLHHSIVLISGVHHQLPLQR